MSGITNIKLMHVMKKYLYLLSFIFLLLPAAINADTTSINDNKIQIKGDISDEGTTKTSGVEPIDMYIEGTNIDLYFYTKSEFKIEVYNAANTLVYTKTVVKYGGKVLSIDMATWASGSYKIVLNNVTYKKSATANFIL